MIGRNLPVDVTMEILTRLPVKSLMRFKCVCKFWYVLVEDPDFIDKHYETRASLTHNNSILVTRYILPHDYCKRYKEEEEEEDEEYVMFSLLYDEPQKGIQCLDLDRPFRRNSRVIYGHRGIFCVAYKGERRIRHTYLWNPATREYKSLPSTNDPEAPPNACVWKTHLALGFNNKTSHYKVVRVWTFRHFPQYDIPEYYSYKVEICCLSDSKSWRHIDAVPPAELLSGTYCHIYLKGKYYWESLPNCLVSFDFGIEDFQMLLLPNAPTAGTGTYDNWGPILVLNNSLALVSFPIPTNENRIEIWLMNEDGDNVSWAKFMTLDTKPNRWYALGSWKNDHLLVYNYDGKYLSVNISSQETRYIDIELDHLEAPILYNECLVSFERRNGTQLQHLPKYIL